MITKDLKTDIKRFLSDKRYEHTLAVERECGRLAEIFGLDAAETAQLKTAALLHDITKELPTSEQTKLCARFEIPAGEVDANSPKLYHAATGARLARAEYPEAVSGRVFDAVRSHTAGRAGMTTFEKLLYLADYIEETRDFDDCVELRRYFYGGLDGGDIFAHLDRTMLLSFDMTIRELCGGGKYISPTTVDSRNDLLLRMKGLIE